MVERQAGATICWVYDPKAAAQPIQGHRLDRSAEAEQAHNAIAAFRTAQTQVVPTWIASHDKELPIRWRAPPGVNEASVGRANRSAGEAWTRTLDAWSKQPDAQRIDDGDNTPQHGAMQPLPWQRVSDASGDGVGRRHRPTCLPDAELGSPRSSATMTPFPR